LGRGTIKLPIDGVQGVMKWDGQMNVSIYFAMESSLDGCGTQLKDE
jgi:hypothetical protein